VTQNETSYSGGVFVYAMAKMCSHHEALKIRTDGGHAWVRELGSIGIFWYFTKTLSNVVQNFVHIVPQTTHKKVEIIQ